MLVWYYIHTRLPKTAFLTATNADRRNASHARVSVEVDEANKGLYFFCHGLSISCLTATRASPSVKMQLPILHSRCLQPPMYIYRF
jgi:hypothetical protein